MDILTHDVVIVGGGAVGLRAAIATVEADSHLSMALISKVCLTYALLACPKDQDTASLMEKPHGYSLG